MHLLDEGDEDDDETQDWGHAINYSGEQCHLNDLFFCNGAQNTNEGKDVELNDEVKANIAANQSLYYYNNL